LFITLISMGIMRILFVICNDMMGNKDNILFLAILRWLLMTVFVVLCTDMMGTNYTFVCSLHWCGGEKWQIYLFLALKNWGLMTLIFFRCIDMMVIIDHYYGNICTWHLPSSKLFYWLIIVRFTTCFGSIPGPSSGCVTT